MIQLTIEMSEGALAALRQEPATFTRELRLAGLSRRCDDDPLSPLREQVPVH